LWNDEIIPYNPEFILFFFGKDIMKLDMYEEFGKYADFFPLLLKCLRTGKSFIHEMHELLGFVEFITHFCLPRARAYVITLAECISGGLLLKGMEDICLYESQYINVQSTDYTSLATLLTSILLRHKDSLPLVKNIIKCRYMDVNNALLKYVLLHFEVLVNPNRLMDLTIALDEWDDILLDEWKYVFFHNFLLKAECQFEDEHRLAISEILKNENIIQIHSRMTEENEFLRRSLKEILELIEWKNVPIPKISEVYKPHKVIMDSGEIREFEESVAKMLEYLYLKEHNFGFIFLIHSFANPPEFLLDLLNTFNELGKRQISIRGYFSSQLALHYILTRYGNVFPYNAVKYYIEESDLMFVFFLIYLIKTRSLANFNNSMRRIPLRYIRRINYKILMEFITRLHGYLYIPEQPYDEHFTVIPDGYASNEERFVYDMYFRWKCSYNKFFENDSLDEHFERYYQELSK
jgi:hypothetical protein